MRIHTNQNVDINNVYLAISFARASGTVTEHKSRSHAHAFDVKLTGNSRRRPNGGSYGASDAYAATWDQWGVFLAQIFELDPEAKCWAYTDKGDFDWQTGDRFDSALFPKDAHGDHKFEYAGILCTGASLTRCTKCTATKRSQFGAY